MSKGLFISFEGPDGSGKSTQAKLLCEYIKSRGTSCIYTREPGGTPVSEAIRELLLDPSHREMDGRTEALLYAASRAQHCAEKIKPALDSGISVVCDRFVDSSIAYQAYARGLGDDVRMINAFAVNGVMPDMTFFLDIPPEEGMKRVDRVGKRDRLEAESAAFHREVYKGYLKLAEIFRDRYVMIDAARSVGEIAEDIRKRYEDYVACGNKT